MIEYNRLPEIFKNLKSKGLYYSLESGMFDWHFNGINVFHLSCRGTTVYACYRNWDIGPDEKCPVTNFGYYNDIRSEDELYKVVDYKLNFYSECLKEFKKRKIEVKKQELNKDFEAT